MASTGKDSAQAGAKQYSDSATQLSKDACHIAGKIYDATTKACGAKCVSYINIGGTTETCDGTCTAVTTACIAVLK